MAMDEVPGSVGTSASLALRLGQTIFSSASLLFMSLGVPFYSYTSFWLMRVLATLMLLDDGRSYIQLEQFPIVVNSAFLNYKSLIHFCSFHSFLVTIMGLVIPWSFTLALIDGYSVLVKCPIRRSGMAILVMIIIGDSVLSILTLAGACSTASVADLLMRAGAPYCPSKVCSRYQLSATMAFLSWSLSLASSLFNLWLLPHI